MHQRFADLNVTRYFQIIPYHLESMDFGTEIDGTEDFFQMFWPIIVSHKIGKIWGWLSTEELSTWETFKLSINFQQINLLFPFNRLSLYLLNRFYRAQYYFVLNERNERKLSYVSYSIKACDKTLSQKSKVLNFYDGAFTKLCLVQTRSRHCGRSQLGTSLPKCSLKLCSRWKESPRRQGTQFRWTAKYSKQFEAKFFTFCVNWISDSTQFLPRI